MNLFTLPKSMRPGSYLMSKAIINNPNVINMIITALLNVKNDHQAGNSEWDNVTRSDIVLEPNSSASDLPPIIIEIQHIIDRLFMKRVMNYSLHASKRRKMDSIMLITSTGVLHFLKIKGPEDVKIAIISGFENSINHNR